eukprot:TRINITY_DN957_c0_g2_i1.p1 TRINITY_DN957_c0_g2~~TRINITY_DN957_c0_g2_i1.p1  ORF type:complete len:195 (-),score=26.12 TRINITY_DN957_c0_g2_i1:108-692(-)
MIRRPPRSTQSRSSAASDVYKRQYQRRVHGDFNCKRHTTRMSSRLATLFRRTRSIPMRAYYEYDASPRHPTGNPEEQPIPKDIYKYHYVHDVYPDQMGGFHTHKRDPYVLHHLYLNEYHEFDYHGQWWNMGSFFVNLLWFTFPLWLYWIRVCDDERAKAGCGTRSVAYTRGGGFLFDSIIPFQQAGEGNFMENI